MRQQPLTPKQRAIYDFIVEFIRQNHFAPSLYEIGRRFGLSSLATIWKHMETLKAKGWITREYGLSRSVEIVKTGCPCPTCGQQMDPEIEAKVVSKEATNAPDFV